MNQRHEIEDTKEDAQRGCLSLALLLVFAIFLVMVGAISPKEKSEVESTFCMKEVEGQKPVFALIGSFKIEELQKHGFRCVTKKVSHSAWDYIYRQAIKHQIDVKRALSPVE